MSKSSSLVVVVAVAILPCILGCGGGNDTAKGRETPRKRLVRVDVLKAGRTTMKRTTTQPATVHAFYEAHVFAKTAGYLTKLNVDLGTTVKKGDVLAVIGIPEMSKRREAKLAAIRRLQADERRATSELAVAAAGTALYEAKRDEAKAEVGKAQASLIAMQVELDRVSDLVNQQAVADRLKDEAQKKHAAAAAEKAVAEAAVKSAEAELKHALAKIGTAKSDLDVAKAITDVARRELDELDELIKYAQLTARFDGVVTQRNVDPGDLVRDAQTGSGENETPLFVITKLDTVRIRVPVPERDVPLATVGDGAKITLQALPGRVFEGTISRVAGAIAEQTRTMLVEIDLPNPNGHLRPGMFGQATITLAPAGDTLTLPANAVRYDEKGKSYVYVVNTSNQVALTDVQTGLDDGRQIEIIAGLTGDERVVGPLLKRLKTGQSVTVN